MTAPTPRRKSLGVQISKLGATAETDVAGEVSIMENAISTKPTAIVIAATNAAALAGPIEQATAAGIPVIVIDSDANTSKYVTFLATNNETGGKKAADELAACVKARTGKQEGPVAYMTALAGAQSLNDRDKGFVEELKKYPDLKIVEHRTGNNDPARALSDAEDMLTRHPDLVGMFADNEVEGDGAGVAINEKSLGPKLCTVAFDTSDQEIGFVRSGALDGLIVQNPFMMGYAGVWYASCGREWRGAAALRRFGCQRGDQEEYRQLADGGIAGSEEVPAVAVPGGVTGEVENHRAPLPLGRRSRIIDSRTRMDTAPTSTTVAARAPPPEAPALGLRHRLPMETWVAGCTVALWIGLALASPYFLTTGNVFNIMRQVSTDAIIAYGELFTIIPPASTCPSVPSPA